MVQATSGFTAATVAVGRNDKEHGAFHALVAEATERRGKDVFYVRFEWVQTETALQSGVSLAAGADEAPSPVTVLTLGAVRELTRWCGFEIGVGGDVTGYVVPDATGVPRRPPGFIPSVPARAPAGGSHGKDVEHADDEADVVI